MSESNRNAKTNWLVPPFDQWGFKNLQDRAKSIRIPASDQPRQLAHNPKDVEDLQFHTKNGESSVLEQLQASYTDDFVVLKDGVEICQKYFTGKPTDTHILFSCTKSLVGLICELMIAEGKLHRQERVDSYIPELSRTGFGDATVSDLLDMAVALDYSETYNDDESPFLQYKFASGLKPRDANAKYESMRQYLCSFKKKGVHGEKFEYVTPVSEVLGWLVEQVSGKSVDHWLADLWSASGAHHDAYILADAQGKPVCGAGFMSTAEDLAIFGQYLLEHKSLVAPMLSREDTARMQRVEYYRDNLPGVSYNSQWCVWKDKSIVASGIHDQYLYVDYQYNVVIVKLSSKPKAADETDMNSVLMLQAIAAEV